MRNYQLTANKYALDCKRYIGRYIDQCVSFQILNDCDSGPSSDAEVEGLKLFSAFDLTCRAWKE